MIALKKMVEQYGREKMPGSVLLVRPLSQSVHYAQVWPELSEGDITEEPVTARVVYFILAGGKAAGGVELMEANLDAFMLAAHRGKSLFSTAMRQYILPHILQQKPLQRLQINRSEHAERRFEVLKKMFVAIGFTILKEDSELRMVIDASMRPAARFISGENRSLSQPRKEAIRKECLWFAYRLILIRSELELQEGISYLSEEIRDMITKMQEYGSHW